MKYLQSGSHVYMYVLLAAGKIKTITDGTMQYLYHQIFYLVKFQSICFMEMYLKMYLIFL